MDKKYFRPCPTLWYSIPLKYFLKRAVCWGEERFKALCDPTGRLFVELPRFWSIISQQPKQSRLSRIVNRKETENSKNYSLSAQPSTSIHCRVWKLNIVRLESVKILNATFWPIHNWCKNWHFGQIKLKHLAILPLWSSCHYDNILPSHSYSI